MNNIIYFGPFEEQMKNFISLNQAIGYKYEAEAMHLKRFDKFLLQKYPKTRVLSKSIVLEWCKKRTYEAQANQNSRASIIRQFAKYLDSIGIKAYIIPKGYYPTEEQYMPHIYTVDELSRIFSVIDKCKYHYECPLRHEIMPVIFRMIYMCGLRISEARLLRVSDVDLKKGILSIYYSKKDNHRLVPMSDQLTNYCLKYSRKVHSCPKPGDYYFPDPSGKPITHGNLYKNFRRFLWQARISHDSKGYGPRIHDFLHTYAVHCLKKWTEQEKDLTAYLPMLKTYMGHGSFNDTAYYLRLIADVFPNIILKLESQYLEIIPQLKGDTNETN